MSLRAIHDSLIWSRSNRKRAFRALILNEYHMWLWRNLACSDNKISFLSCPQRVPVFCQSQTYTLGFACFFFFFFSRWRRWKKYLLSHQVSPRILAAAWVPVAVRIWYLSFKSYKLICWFFCQKRNSKSTWNGNWAICVTLEKYF